jgi:hypothetical protein
MRETSFSITAIIEESTMPDYAIVHNGRAFTPNQTALDANEADAHNKRIEAAELAFLATKPERFSAYVGKKLGDAMGCDKFSDQSRRELNTWTGFKIGTCFLSSSWRVNSFMGDRMFQIYAIVNGVDYTGRGFGEGMLCNFRRCKSACAKRSRNWSEHASPEL